MNTPLPRLRPFVSTARSSVAVEEELVALQPRLRASEEYDRFENESRDRQYTLAEVFELNADNPGNAPSSSSDWTEINVKVPTHTERQYMLKRPQQYPKNRYIAVDVLEDADLFDALSRERNYTVEEVAQLKRENPGGEDKDWTEITVEVPTHYETRYVLNRPARYPNNRFVATYIRDLLPEGIEVESIPIFLARVRATRGVPRFAGPLPPPVSTTRFGGVGTRTRPVLPPLRGSRVPAEEEEGMTVAASSSGASRRVYPRREYSPSVASSSEELPWIPTRGVSRAPSGVTVPSRVPSGVLPSLRGTSGVSVPSRVPSVVLPPLRGSSGVSVPSRVPSRLPLPPSRVQSGVLPPPLTRLPSRLPTRVPTRLPTRSLAQLQQDEEGWEVIPEGYDFSS